MRGGLPWISAAGSEIREFRASGQPIRPYWGRKPAGRPVDGNAGLLASAFAAACVRPELPGYRLPHAETRPTEESSDLTANRLLAEA
jgi:hypothetical protein